MPSDLRPSLKTTCEPATWRVWLVTDVYPPNCGGSGWSTHALARVLTDNGHSVDVIVVNQSRTDVTTRNYDGICITEVGVRASRTLRNRLGVLDYAHQMIAEYLDARLRVEPDVNILHAQHLHSGPPTVAVGRAHGLATVATVRDYWPVCLHGTCWWDSSDCNGCTKPNLMGCMGEYWSWPRPASRLMVGWARRRLRARAGGLGAADSVVTVSEAVRHRIEGSLSDADLSVVPNIVDPEAVRAAAEPNRAYVDRPYLLTAGKLQPTKGFDLLLNALSEISSELPLVVAGDGPSRAKLEAQAATVGVSAKFLGWVDHGRLLGLQRDARAVVLPSAWREPLSRIALETMALGTPVIAWARGGMSEIIQPGVTGWLVSQPSELYTALTELRSPERRRQVGHASLLRVNERFSPEAVYPTIAQLYAAAIEKCKPARTLTT